MAKKQPKPKKVSGGKSTQIKPEKIAIVKQKHGERHSGDAKWQFHGDRNRAPYPIVDPKLNPFFNWRGESKKRQSQSDKVWGAMQAVRDKKRK